MVSEVTCGKNQAHHDYNLERFLKAAKSRNLTYNPQKCVFSTKTLLVALGHRRRTNCEALDAFNLLKRDIANATLRSIDESLPFLVETDASDYAIAATLSQQGRPVAFFSRTLNRSELKHATIEKEAAAIIEAVRKWKHYLTGRRFSLITDQKSVSYMFNTKHSGKIKNDKIMRWRIELSTYDFDIIYRCGEENIPADALSRLNCVTMNLKKLQDLHSSLCHPGVTTRLAHFVKQRNLPFSLDQVRQVVRSCTVCAEIKPQFFKPESVHLIKATCPFERLSLDFKGPLPSTNQNRFLITIIDEYSRFPFAFPCRDTSAKSIISGLDQVFSMFGMPAYIHSDRGSAFMSAEFKRYLLDKGIASSRTTSYNPAGNGQVERLNQTLWQTIKLGLKTHKLPLQHWQELLSDALHSVRSLHCTATNQTPHERIFNFQRRSTSGSSIPSWLATPGPVLIKRHVRSSKFDPLTEEVHLIEANPQYAHVRYPDVKEDTVALKHLAPKPTSNDEILETNRVVEVDSENPANDAAPANESFTTEDVDAEPIQNESLNDPSCETKLRRSQRYDPANY